VLGLWGLRELALKSLPIKWQRQHLLGCPLDNQEHPMTPTEATMKHQIKTLLFTALAVALNTTACGPGPATEEDEQTQISELNTARDRTIYSNWTARNLSSNATTAYGVIATTVNKAAPSQRWTRLATKQVQVSAAGPARCMTANAATGNVSMAACNAADTRQQWDVVMVLQLSYLQTYRLRNVRWNACLTNTASLRPTLTPCAFKSEQHFLEYR
jgi:hypothetical protein